MSERRFDIVFRGETRGGLPAAQVRDAFARLFKLPAERVAPLFSGKPCVLKKDLSEADAVKYRDVLARIGAEVELREHAAAGPETAKGSDRAQPAFAYGWSVAPPGELLRQAERPQIQAIDVPDSGLTLASVFTIVEPSVETPTPAPDTSNITLAEPGADIGPGGGTEPTAPAPDTGHISLAPVGPFPSQPAPPPANVGDLSQLTLAPPGEDLLKPDERAEAPQPPELAADFELIDEPVDDEVSG